MQRTRIAFWCTLALALLIGAPLALAQDSTSTSFQILDPVAAPGGFGTSSSFQLYGAFSQSAIGTSTSASFGLNGGFLFFPFASSPVVSATAGSTQVSLTWTSAQAALGFAVGSYEVGQATASGGPYSFSNVGNVLASTRTGLANGTTYFFVVRALDAFNDVIATSTEVSAAPVAANNGGGGGGGGGGGSGLATVILIGHAYPSSPVTVLRDGQVVSTVNAGPDASFDVQLTTLTPGFYIFSVYADDARGDHSTQVSFPTSLISGSITTINGIFIAPTIDVDKSQVKQGDTIRIFGASVPHADVTITVNSDQTFFATTSADASGSYLYNFDTTPLELGDHSTKSKAVLDSTDEISGYSNTVGFTVGDQNIANTPKCRRGDLNCDGRVNLIDFSIAAFWIKRSLAGPIIATEEARLNGDGKIDLVDFSIMAFYWTG